MESSEDCLEPLERMVFDQFSELEAQKQAALDDAERKADEMSRQLEAQSDELSLLRNSKAIQANCMMAMENEVLKVKSDRDNCMEAIAKLKIKLEDVEAKLSVKIDECETAQTSRMECSKRVESLESQVASLKQELSSKKDVMNYLRASNIDHASHRYALAQEVDILRSRITLKKEHLDSLSIKLDNYLDKVSSLEDANNALVEDMINSADQFREEKELFASELDHTQEELEAIFLKNKERQVEIRDLTALLDETALNCKKLEKKNVSLSRQSREMQDELEYYFLLSKSQRLLLDIHAKNQRRAERLLSVLSKRDTKGIL